MSAEKKKQIESKNIELSINKEILKSLTQKSINENHINNVKKYYINNSKEFEVNINDIYFHNIVKIEETISKNSNFLSVDLNEVKPEILIFLYNIKLVYEYFYKIAKEENLVSNLKEAETSIKDIEKIFLPESFNPNTRNLINTDFKNVFPKIKLKEIALSKDKIDIKINRDRKKDGEYTKNIQSNALLDELETTILNTIYDFIQNKQSYIDAANGYRDKKRSKAGDQRQNKTFIKNEVKPFFDFLINNEIESKAKAYKFISGLLYLIEIEINEETIKRALLE